MECLLVLLAMIGGAVLLFGLVSICVFIFQEVPAKLADLNARLENLERRKKR